MITRQARLPMGELDELIKESIAFIQEHEPPEGYFVGFSGGKDSITTLELTRMAGVKYQAYFTDTGIEHKEVYACIKKHYPEVIWLKPKMTIFEGIRKKAPPTRMIRWCCDVIKKNPAKHIPLKHRLMGIRAEESMKRASRPRISSFSGQTTYKPIFFWEMWAVCDFIQKYSLPYPSLYDKGFKRIGCQVCPFFLKQCDFTKGVGKIYKNACRDWYENYRSEIHKEKYKNQTFKQWWHWYTTF